MGNPLMVVAAVVGAGATVASINQQKKAADLSAKQQAVQTQRSQRQAIREAQIRRSQVQASSVAAGSNLGSGLAGGMSSLGSQIGGSLGFSTQMSGLSNQITMAGSRASTYGAMGELGFTAFGKLGGWDKVFGLFNKEE
jgi:uncharacterized protein YcfJ